MALSLRQRTQNAIDGLRTTVGGCEFAMLVDLETGLVLAKSSEVNISHDRLEHLATSAVTELNGALASSLPALVAGGDMLTLFYVGKEEIIGVVKSVHTNEEALVCAFAKMPDQADLARASAGIFNVATEAEAA